MVIQDAGLEFVLTVYKLKTSFLNVSPGMEMYLVRRKLN